jgi:hypothetical protein
VDSSPSEVITIGGAGEWLPRPMDLMQKRTKVGRPLSPYLFLIVADVLQTLIWAEGDRIRHPLTSQAYPVLQYADDTVLVICAESSDVSHLKMYLDHFAQVTGLKINFHKSIVVPMHVHATQAQELVHIFQCQQCTFP